MGKRASGILLHITSLPSKYGVGDLGPDAYKFADFLVKARQSYWQVLPLNPLTLGKNPYSPYNSLSAFAGNTLLISPELLYRQGLLTKKQIQDSPVFPESRVDYRLVISHKSKFFDIAFERFKQMPNDSDYEKFCSNNKSWLENFATFVTLRRHFHNRLWCNWPRELRDRIPSALKSVRVQMKDSIEREKFLQYLFFKQWFSLRHYCNEHGINLIGDIPIYVAYDSADVWGHPEIFKLTKAKKPRFIGGVPPDHFSRTGQLWGNPVYNWNVLKNMHYNWWIQRVKHNLDLFDIVRIDHFRGFIAYWQVAASAKNAVKGRWIKGPGEDFFKTLFKYVSSKAVIAEDLGFITPDVKEIIEKFRLPSMRVLLFAFDEDPATNLHCPHNHTKQTVVYTGTHDNNTTRGWFEKEAKPAQKKIFSDYLGHKVSAKQPHWEMIQLAMSSVAELVITPMQDILGLGEQARMNRPGTIRGNWIWRLTYSQTKLSIASKILKLTEIHSRA